MSNTLDDHLFVTTNVNTELNYLKPVSKENYLSQMYQNLQELSPNNVELVQEGYECNQIVEELNIDSDELAQDRKQDELQKEAGAWRQKADKLKEKLKNITLLVNDQSQAILEQKRLLDLELKARGVQ